jgi:uncharacterized iron-regulated membrane protein
VKKFIFWTHLVLGVTAGLVILSTALTGTIIAFEPQIVDFAERRARAVPPPAPGQPRLSLAEVAAGVAAAHPGKAVSGLTVASDPGAPVVVSFGREGTAYADPYTGRVLGGESKAHRILHAVEEWHRWLVSRERGRPITGAANAAFFFLVLTGLYNWFPRSVLRFNTRLRGKARDWNWHSVIGFWSAAVLVVTTLTGVVMSYSWATALLYRATGNEPPPVVERAKVDKRPEVPAPADDPDALFAAASAKSVGWKSISIRYPQKPGGSFTASVLENSRWHPAARSMLTFDSSGKELKWEPFSEANWGKKLRFYTKVLHTGQAFGLVGQIVAFLGSAGGVFLVWTGFALSWRRFRAWREEKKAVVGVRSMIPRRKRVRPESAAV